MKGQQLPVREACANLEIDIPDSQVDKRMEETYVGKSQLWNAGQENGSTTEDETSQEGEAQDEYAEERGCLVQNGLQSVRLGLMGGRLATIRGSRIECCADTRLWII